MGVKTKAFGPYAWTVFEGLSNYYDEFVKRNQDDTCLIKKIKCYMTEAMFSIGFILPCIYCRISYRSFTNPDDPDNENINIHRMLLLEDGAKKLVYHLHRRVSKKLEDQEINKAGDDIKEIKTIKSKWKTHNIPYRTALQKQFPDLLNRRFWNALIVFLGYVMCDYREEEQSFILNFIKTFGKMLQLETDPDVELLSKCYQKSLKHIDLLCGKMDTLSQRIDIVWTIQKYVFEVQGWDFTHTPESFEVECKKSIVTECDKKRNVF
jgi:hypothetical protein